MAFSTTSTIFTVATYCQRLVEKSIIVNRNYQRSSEVWPVAAKAFLIETILLGFPVPKIFLYQRTDLRSRVTISEIVDGQQRSEAILDFFSGRLALPRRSEIPESAGKKYDELPDDLKGRFLAYNLSVELFTIATPEQIREAFRRMNAYNVPLNPEEQRHARFQGAMKGFVHKLSRDYDAILVMIGTFTEKNLARMADAKLYSEVIHGVLWGISTTKKAELDKLYRVFDLDFPREAEIRSWIDLALETILGWEELHGTPLMKHYHLYCLILALMQVQQQVSLPGQNLQSGLPMVETQTIRRNLSLLAGALEEEEGSQEGFFDSFLTASSKSTNVREQRLLRFEWFRRALTEQFP